MKRQVIFASALLCLTMLAPAAHAANQLSYISGPEAAVSGWTVPVMVIHAGDSLTYFNVDVAQHDFVAQGAYGSDTKPWCAAYAPGACPIFFTPLVGTLGPKPLQGNVGVPIQGIEQVQAGKSYTFVCTIHSSMVGTLIVLPV